MLRASAATIRFQSVHGATVEAGGPPETAAASSAFFKFCAPYQPYSFLLQIDHVTVLLDAGCPANYTNSKSWLTAYAAIAHKIDAVLISSPEIMASGAIPFLHKLNPHIQIIALTSTSRMGAWGSLGAFRGQFGAEATFEYFSPPKDQGGKSSLGPRIEKAGSAAKGTLQHMTVTAEDVYRAFRSIKEPYGGKASISPTCELSKAAALAALGLSAGEDAGSRELTAANTMRVEARPIRDGRVLGGNMWMLSYQSDEICYAPSYHFSMRRENSLFLKPMAVEGLSEGSIGGGASGTAYCNILITDGSTYPRDAKGLLRYAGHELPAIEGIKPGISQQHLSPKAITNLLCTNILESLRGGCEVLCPVDLAGRGLELLAVLDAFAEERSLPYDIVLVSPFGRKLIDETLTMTSSLTEDVLNADRKLFSHIHCVRTVSEAMDLRRQPRVLVCDGADLDSGTSVEALDYLVDSATHTNSRWTLCMTHYAASWTNAGKIVNTLNKVLVSGPQYTGAGGAVPPTYGNGKLPIEGEHADVVNLSYTLCRVLREEEQEEHFKEVERKRQEALASAAELSGAVGDVSSEVIVDEDAEVDAELNLSSEDEDEDDGGEVAAAPGKSTKRNPSPPIESASDAVAPKSAVPTGLFLPQHLRHACESGAYTFKSKHLAFPLTTSFAASVSRTPNERKKLAYGLPLQDWEITTIQRRAPTRTATNRLQATVEREGGHIASATVEDILSTPISVTTVVDKPTPLIGCSIILADLSGLMDVVEITRFLSRRFAKTKKFIFVRGTSVAETQQHVILPLKRHMRTEWRNTQEATFSLQHSYATHALELATHIAAFDVRLSAEISSVMNKGLHRLQELSREGGRDAIGGAGRGAATSSSMIVVADGPNAPRVEGADGRRVVANQWSMGWFHGCILPTGGGVAATKGVLTNGSDPSETAMAADANPSMTGNNGQLGVKRDRGENTANGGDDEDGGDGSSKRRISFVDDSAEEKNWLADGTEEGMDGVEGGGLSSTTAASSNNSKAETDGENSGGSLSTPSSSSSSSTGENRNVAAAMWNVDLVPTEKKRAALVEMQRQHVLEGSVFVGTCDLGRLREGLRKEFAYNGNGNLVAEYAVPVLATGVGADGSENMLPVDSSMLVVNQQSYVRLEANGDVSLECVISPEAFSVRRAVYSQFALNL